jgi:hypothetical protein
VPRIQEFSQLYIVTKHANLHFASQNVSSAHIVLLNESQFTEPFEMMHGDARAAEMQRPLNLSNAHRIALPQEKPVNIPILSAKYILKLAF